MANKPSKESFHLKKVDMPKDGRVKVHYDLVMGTGEEGYVSNLVVDLNVYPHPDLVSSLSSFVGVLARVYNLDFVERFVAQEKFAADKGQKKIAVAAAETLQDTVRVTGIHIGGTNEKENVIVVGSLKSDNQQAMKVKTHALGYDTDKFGFEKELEDMVEEVRNEVYAFLFENKKAQLELMDTE